MKTNDQKSNTVFPCRLISSCGLLVVLSGCAARPTITPAEEWLNDPKRKEDHRGDGTINELPASYFDAPPKVPRRLRKFMPGDWWTLPEKMALEQGEMFALEPCAKEPQSGPESLAQSASISGPSLVGEGDLSPEVGLQMKLAKKRRVKPNILPD